MHFEKDALFCVGGARRANGFIFKKEFIKQIILPFARITFHSDLELASSNAACVGLIYMT